MSDVAPSESKVQQEAIQFNQPAGESSQASMAALANALREIISPVGTVVYSMLTEAQFQTQNTSPSPARWILADGRSVAGSQYEAITGFSTVPDLRGVFVRGKNHARSGATGNPDGDLALGTYTADKYISHNHGITDPGHNHTITDPGHFHGMNPDQGDAGQNYEAGSDRSAINNAPFGTGNATATAMTGLSLAAVTTGVTTNLNGGNETSPRNVTLNAFIRIN